MMKAKAALEKYFRKRIDSITFLMEKPVQRYTKAYFHNLRLEIKKLHALFDLMDFCSKDFQSEFFFKPFKKIFKQAGKVRELHLQEEGLKRYVLKYSIKNYFNNLKKLRLNEQRTFLVMKNEKQSTLKWGKYYKSILPYFKGIDKKDVTAYIKYKRKKIETLIAPKALKEKQVHQLRKLFKEFYYISKSSNLPGIEMYKSSGTPVDCVKLAVNKIFKGKKPDLCVSGINHGLNHSINVIYSGTMSAAVEGAIESIPSIGFSFDDFTYDADFSKCLFYVKTIAQQVLKHGLPPGTLLNVNIPNVPSLKGIKICRQANAKYAEEFDERTDPHKRNYYWLTGVFQLNDHGEDTDVWALNNHYVSLVPVQFDMTDHHAIPTLNTWDFDVKEK